MSHNELKRTIIRFAEDGLVKYVGMTSEQAKNKVKQSTLEKSIDRAPDIIAHYSQEQLVAAVIR